MLDHQHGDAEQAPDVLDPERHVLGLLHAEAGGRLVEQQELGLGAQRARHLHHLAHAVGQVGDEAVAIGLQIEEVDHLLHRLAMRQLVRAHARQEQQLLHEARAPVGVAAEQQVLQHGGVLEQLDVLERPRDAPPGDLVRRHPRDVLAAEEQAARGRVVDARDQVEDGGLARAVGPDDGEDLPGLHLEAHAVERLDAAEVDREPVRREEASPQPLRAHVGLLAPEGGALVERERREVELDLQPAPVDAERLEQDEQHEDEPEDAGLEPGLLDEPVDGARTVASAAVLPNDADDLAEPAPAPCRAPARSPPAGAPRRPRRTARRAGCRGRPPPPSAGTGSTAAR